MADIILLGVALSSICLSWIISSERVLDEPTFINIFQAIQAPVALYILLNLFVTYFDGITCTLF